MISPLLANVYLHALDRAWQERHWRLGQLTRYADDLVICCWKPGHAHRARAALAAELAALGLRLSEQKTRIVTLEVGGEGFDFLGFHFGRVRSRTSGKPYIACWPSHKAVAAAKQRIRDLTPLGRVGLPAIMVVQDGVDPVSLTPPRLGVASPGEESRCQGRDRRIRRSSARRRCGS